jgi:hypothetical protein
MNDFLALDSRFEIDLYGSVLANKFAPLIIFTEHEHKHKHMLGLH